MLRACAPIALLLLVAPPLAAPLAAAEPSFDCRTGFDQFLAELASLSAAQLADEGLMDELNRKYDIINLGDVPPWPA